MDERKRNRLRKSINSFLHGNAKEKLIEAGFAPELKKLADIGRATDYEGIYEAIEDFIQGRSAEEIHKVQGDSVPDEV